MENEMEFDGRQLHTTALLDAPLQLVWRAWTDAHHVAQWWGPKGFTNTIHTMELRPGGEWKLTMHGPDGKDYANRSVFLEIVPLQKIVFEHFNPHFITTVIFDSLGAQTQIDWTLLFDSVEMYEIIVKTHKADQGQTENLEKLTAYLAQLRNESASE